MQKSKNKEISITLNSVSAEDMPTYVKVNGVVYEKITKDTENVDIELDKDVLEFVAKLVDEGLYVNEQEAIRDVIRTYLQKAKY